MGTVTKSLVRVERLQPEGPSFTMTDNSLLEWQKWRLRISLTPRECVVLHDIRFDYRSVVHRLSFSELTVPYCDPRPLTTVNRPLTTATLEPAAPQITLD
ncbi:copper amine oxidase 1 [Metarhizium brunneum]